MVWGVCFSWKLFVCVDEWVYFPNGKFLNALAWHGIQGFLKTIHIGFVYPFGLHLCLPSHTIVIPGYSQTFARVNRVACTLYEVSQFDSCSAFDFSFLSVHTVENNGWCSHCRVLVTCVRDKLTPDPCFGLAQLWLLWWFCVWTSGGSSFCWSVSRPFK